MKRIQSHKGVIGTMVVNAEGMCVTGQLLDVHRPARDLNTNMPDTEAKMAIYRSDVYYL